MVLPMAAADKPAHYLNLVLLEMPLPSSCISLPHEA